LVSSQTWAPVANDGRVFTGHSFSPADAPRGAMGTFKWLSSGWSIFHQAWIQSLNKEKVLPQEQRLAESTMTRQLGHRIVLQMG
jgi:hypothetical protein